MEIRILNPAPRGLKFTSLRRATHLVKKGRAIWSGNQAIKLISGERRIVPARLPMQQAAATKNGINTKGLNPLYDTPVGVWGLWPVAR